MLLRCARGGAAEIDWDMDGQRPGTDGRRLGHDMRTTIPSVIVERPGTQQRLGCERRVYNEWSLTEMLWLAESVVVYLLVYSAFVWRVAAVRWKMGGMTDFITPGHL